MNHSAHVLYHMVKADFLERVRRYSFLMTLAGALYLAYAITAEKVVVRVGEGYRGQYNSAWIGMAMAVCCSTFLSLFGFYVVKNSIERDSTTRVGRILAATPMRKESYTVAKTVSNFAVLACMVAVLMMAAIAMQWLRPEGRPISLWQLWSPFLLIALPAMFVPASLAVLFETLPVLRGGVGNVIYFFVWTFGLAAGAQSGFDDATGIHVLAASTRQALERLNPGGNNSGFSLTIGSDRVSHTFLWSGVDWNWHLVASRLTWIAVGVGVAMLASVFFHRFDPARDTAKEKKQKNRNLFAEVPALAVDPGRSFGYAALTQFIPAGRSRFARLVLSELALMLKGLRWWWHTAAVGLLVAEFASPNAPAREGVLLAAWIWPVLIWSQMGCRESRHATQSLIFSAERVVYRQLLAIWTAGVLVAIATGAGAGVRLLLSSDWHAAAGWFAGALFIPSMALALGVWSGSTKFFEALYTVWWYVGPLHQLPGLDFMGTSPASSSPVLYLTLAAASLLAACAGRRQQVAYA